MSSDINQKVVQATKWSSITEILAKLVSPLTTMILARLLTPEAFGIVATITMVISFAEIFTDAGFCKYIIQHEFKDNIEERQCANVAFWSNLGLSLLIWIVIVIFCEPLANLVGCEGHAIALIAACAAIPLEAFSGIQTSLYKRHLDFKTLFGSRILGVFTPLIVTTPLAFILRSFWALVIGTIVQNLIIAIYLTVKSEWKPGLYYNWNQFKQMFGFSMWTVFESVSIWLTSYADFFLVGTLLSQYYLGIYRTSMATVGGIVGVITAATTPVLFSSLSRLQNDEEVFQKLFFRFQKIVSIVVVPIGIGIFVFSDVVTAVMLGDQWNEAIGFIGLWGLMSTITILFSYYASEVYRSLGKPKLSAMAQWLHIVFLIPFVYLFAKRGFDQLYIARSLVRLQLVVVNCLLLFFCCRISTFKMTKNVFPSFIAGAIMAVVGVLLKMVSSNIVINILFIIICAVVYFLALLAFKPERMLMLKLKNFIVAKYIRRENVKLNL